MKILAIETSCDETAIAIADFSGPRTRPRVKVYSHIVSSQMALHAKFGGVVPNLARREHEKNLVPILVTALNEANLKNKKYPRKTKELDRILAREPLLLAQLKKSLIPLAIPDIDAIAVTYGPGLAPALWVGVNFARALSYLWDKPLIPANHMAGHLYSALLQKTENNSGFKIPPFTFPVLALLVSGNHTELVVAKKPWHFQVIGQTRDDAAGEVFDKVARLMGLPYPGGPAISRLAQKGDPKTYPLPSPMINTKNYDFSFSGLKTAALYLIRDITGSMSWKTKSKLTARQKTDIAASFEKAAVDVLIAKTVRAARIYKTKTILLGGGVSANEALRAALAAAIKKQVPGSTLFIPDLSLTGDNALMIAAAAYFSKKKKPWTSIRADANVRLGDQ